MDKDIKNKKLAILKKRGKRLLAVDFSTFIFEIAYLECFEGSIHLIHFEVVPIPPQETKTDEFITGAILKFLKKNAIHERNLMLSISDIEAVSIKTITLPVLPRAEILNAAKWQLKEEVPFNMEQVYIDWQVIKAFADKEGAQRNEIIFMIVKKDALDRYLEIVAKCKLKATAITTSSFNYAFLLKSQKDNPAHAAVLDIDFKASTLGFYTGSQLNVVRVLPISWEKLTTVLTETFAADKVGGRFSFEEAEDIKDNFGIVEDETQAVKGNIQGSHIISLIRPVLEALVRELRFSFNYFSASLNLPMPAKLYITGGGANLKNLDRYLSKELNMPVEYLIFPTKEESPPSKISKIDQNKIMNAVGAALADTKVMNLLPIEVKAKRNEFLEQMSLRLFTVLAAGVLFVWAFFTEFQVRDYQNRLKISQMHIKTAETFNTLKAKLRLKQELLNKIQKKELVVDGILKSLSQFTPKEIIFYDLTLAKEAHNINLRGSVAASDDIAGKILTEFVEQLENSPFFREVSLVSTKTMELSRDFEIKCDLAF